MASSIKLYHGLQAALRGKLGEGTTTFERITDGSRTVSKGDVVRINVKPQLVGRVVAFTIPQVRSHAMLRTRGFPQITTSQGLSELWPACSAPKMCWACHAAWKWLNRRLYYGTLAGSENLCLLGRALV
jgi:hypothetical protein